MKLTTDSIQYHSEIKRLLTSEFDDEWTPLWNYCEMTSMLITGHSWTFLMKNGLATRKLIYREWNRAELGQKNDFGIYSLENIKIKEKELSVSLNEIYEIQNILKLGLEISETQKIVLDGTEYELTDFKTSRKYNWKIEEEIDNNLKKIIEIITNKNST
ncbi:hypothetical protein [Lacinutrix sp. MEBiC02595]